MSKLSKIYVAAALFLGFAAPAHAQDALIDFFTGKSLATGKFSAINGVKRDFTVKLNGKWNGKQLSLREDFFYADGERNRKTWVLTKTGEGRYNGVREDVVGIAKITVSGQTARFNYFVDIDASPVTNIVHFYDTLHIAPDGKTLANTAIVTKYGLPVARVKVDFQK